jgi:hypothetical protein
LHLPPLRDPPGQPAEGEHDGEHLGGDAHRAVDDAAVEVDVRVELALDEVLVGQRHLLEALGDVEERVAGAQLGEHLVGGDLEDLRPRVEVLVDAVAEAHQRKSESRSFAMSTYLP